MQQVIIKRIILIKSVIFNPLGWSNNQATLGARFRTNVVLCFPCD